MAAIITPFWWGDLLCLLFIALFTLHLYMSRNYNYWKKRGIKGTKPRPIFGDFAPCILAQKTPEEFLRELYFTGKGEQFLGYYVLDRPHLMLRDPELIKYVMIKDFSNFTERYLSGAKNDVMSDMNLFLAKNPPWKFIRQKMSPIATSGKLKKMFDLMLEIGKDLDGYLESLKLDGDGRPIEVKDICAMFTTDLIGSTAYGMRFNSLTNPDAEFRKHGKTVFRNTYKRYLDFLTMMFMPQLLNPMRVKWFDEKPATFLKKVFWDAINQRIRSGERRADLVDMLVELKKSQDNDPDKNSFKLEGDALVCQAAIFFTGGFDTSSITMSFALYEIAKHPEVQDRLRVEILSAIDENGGNITYDMITTLPYLEMVVAETLRLYPVLGFLDRVPEKDYQFPGTNVVLEKGVPVTLPMRALHMDPEYFPNPEVFDPERFTEENKKLRPACVYFPFGEGPRSCVGMRIGLLQSKLGIIKFISKYELAPCEETPIPMEFHNLNPFTNPLKPLVINIKKISSIAG